MPEITLVTLAPGHFHAALIHKRRPLDVSRFARLYAPPDTDLVAHLERIVGFNTRSESPTDWQTQLYCGSDFLRRFRDEAKPGEVAVIAGRNDRKFDLIKAALDAGLHVVADKPLIIDPGRLPELRQALALARANGQLITDVMTERFEITSILQRELIADPDVFGEPLPGTADEPGVLMRSVHYLKKMVAGNPLRRPEWFFDIGKQGEALADVGTHLVDLSMWLVFPDQAIPEGQVNVTAHRRWPIPMTAEQYQTVTGAERTGDFYYDCNSRVSYTLNGVHVTLDVLWDYESPTGGGDLHHCQVRGSRATIIVSQGEGPGAVPELSVRPAALRARVEEVLTRRVASWQDRFPGVSIVVSGGEYRLGIPDCHRVGHEAHFGQVLELFLSRLRAGESGPGWEWDNLPVKYRVTTAGGK